MSLHTKRSAAFLLRLQRLTEKLRSNTLDLDERDDLISILQNNTTDTACLVKASDQEPVFVLRGKDALAPNIVARWASLYAEAYGSSGDGELPGDKQLVYNDALLCAAEMSLWPSRVPN